MGAVAVGRIAGVLAAAKKGKLGSLGGEHQWLDAGPGLRPVAKGLLLASPAATPGIALAGFEFHLIRAELRPFWLGHAFGFPHCRGWLMRLLSQFAEAAQESALRRWDNWVSQPWVWRRSLRRLFSAGGFDHLPDRVDHQLRLFDLNVVA